MPNPSQATVQKWFDDEDRFEVWGVIGHGQWMNIFLSHSSNRETRKCGCWWTGFIPANWRADTHGTWRTAGHYLSCSQTPIKPHTQRVKTTSYRLLFVVCWTCSTTTSNFLNAVRKIDMKQGLYQLLESDHTRHGSQTVRSDKEGEREAACCKSNQAQTMQLRILWSQLCTSRSIVSSLQIHPFIRKRVLDSHELPQYYYRSHFLFRGAQVQIRVTIPGNRRILWFSSPLTENAELWPQSVVVQWTQLGASALSIYQNIGYMFRPNIRSSSGLRQTNSSVLCVYWDPNMYDSRKNT